MAKPRIKHFDRVVEMLLDQVPMKEIAYTLKVPYNTVATISHNFFKSTRTLKKRIPNPLQGSFFDKW